MCGFCGAGEAGRNDVSQPKPGCPDGQSRPSSPAERDGCALTWRSLSTALGGYLSLRVLFEGAGLDRLRDRRHAELVDSLVGLLRELGWEVATEASFNEYGERGSIDILAFHPSTRMLLVVEVKTVVPDLGGMLSTFDRKVRLARDIAAAPGMAIRSGCQIAGASRRQHSATAGRPAHRNIRECVPCADYGVRTWLRTPSGSLPGLMFLSTARGAGHRRTEHAPRPQPQPSSRTSY